MKIQHHQHSLIGNETSVAAEALAKMTKLFSEGRRPPRAALDRIVSFFHKRETPVFLGQVALDIGYSLDQTEAMLEALIDVGIVRRLTLDEKKKIHDMHPNAMVYALTCQAKPGLAGW